MTEASLTAFRCGSTTHRLGALFRSAARGSRTFPSWAFLYDDGEGRRVLFDAGYRAGAWGTGPAGLAYRALVPPRIRPEWGLATQLREAEIDPASVTDVVISHLHPDHIGGLVDFQHARWIMSRGTADLASHHRLLDGVLAGLLPGTFPPADALVVEPDEFRPARLGVDGPSLRVADPLGDERFVLVDLPGHSSGHTGALVGGALLLAGDAAWGGDLLAHCDDLRPLPRRIMHDASTYVETSRTLIAAREAGIRVVFSHDADVPARVSL